MVEPLKHGVNSTLFPMMSGAEDRATSIFFAIMEMVYPFRDALLKSIGKSAYASGNDFECLLRPSFGGRLTKKDIPDAVIHLHQRKEWTALVEVKIGSAELDKVQISNYLNRALSHGIDTLITISNELCAEPSQPPLRLKPAEKKHRKVNHFHWSWRFIQHQCELLLKYEDLTELESALLKQFSQFLAHEKSGIAGYKEMPVCWPAFVDRLRDGGKPDESNMDDVIAGWFQETAELAIILNERLGVEVTEVIAEKTVEQRKESAAEILIKRGDLEASFKLDGEYELDVLLDVNSRFLRLQTRHEPTKRVSTPYVQLEHFIKNFYVEGDPDEWGNHSDVRVFARWPRAKEMTDISMPEAIIDTVEDTLKDSALIRSDKDRLMAIYLRYTPSKVSTTIRSRKKVIELIEDSSIYFAENYMFLDN